jgi:hypothetical protein
MADTSMPGSAQPLPDAGWYPDPAGGDGTRWWDGKGWTDHVQPGPSGVPGDPGVAGAPGAPGAPATGDPELPWWAQAGAAGGATPSWWQDAPAAPGPPPGGAPYAMPVGAYPSRAKLPNAQGAVRALVLGIISLLCCGILGPFAIYEGNQARFRIRVSNGRLGGDGLAIAGMILGAIATVLLLINLLLLATGQYHFGRTTTSG